MCLQIFLYVYFVQTTVGKLNAFSQKLDENIGCHVHFLLYVSFIAAVLFPQYVHVSSAVVAIKIYDLMPKSQTSCFLYICVVLLIANRIPELMQVITERMLPLALRLLAPYANVVRFLYRTRGSAFHRLYIQQRRATAR